MNAFAFWSVPTSPIEKEVPVNLLLGLIPIIICPGRSIHKAYSNRLEASYQSRTILAEKITSIYASPESKAKFMEIYDQKMTEWPVDYEDIFLITEYGVIHVIASGPEDAPPGLTARKSVVKPPISITKERPSLLCAYC